MALVALVVLVLSVISPAHAEQVVRIGSKSFTESYVVAEIAAQAIEATGAARVERHVGLGGTGIAYRAAA